MSQDGDEQNMGLAPENAGETPEEVGTASLARSVASRLSWTRRAVSPWVRRTLATSERDAAGRRASTALSYRATNRFLRRAQRMVEGGRAWAPELGTLDPRNVARFTEEVTARFPGAGKHTVTWLPEEEADHASQFPLPGESQAQPARPLGEGRSPAMGGRPTSAIRTGQARPYDGSATARFATPPSGRPAAAQRAPARRAPPPRPTREPPTGRLFSRVEELPVRGLGADAGANGLSLPPEVQAEGEELDRRITAAEPDDEETFSAEAGPRAEVLRQAYSAPPARGEGAQGDAPGQVGTRALGERAPSQDAGQGSRPPARATSPALQRTGGTPEAGRERDAERRADAPAPLSAELDDGSRADLAQGAEGETQTRAGAPSEPAVEQIQRRPDQQRSQVPPVRAEGARQVEGAPPDRSGTTQQVGISAAAQPPTAQEDAIVPQHDEVGVPRSGESGQEVKRAGAWAAPEAVQGRPERAQPQMEGARAPSRVGDCASPTEGAGQEQGGSQARGAPQQEAAQRSADRVAATAPTEHATGDQDVSVSTGQQGREGVALPSHAGQGAPAARLLPGVPAEEKVPPAPGAESPSRDAAAAPSAKQEDAGERLPLVPGSAAREPSAENEPADRTGAGPGTDGAVTAQWQEGPAVSGGVGELGPGAGDESELPATEQASGTRREAGLPERFESMPARADAESAARPSGEPPDPGAVQRSSVAEEARPGTAAVPDATDTDKVGGYSGDEAGQASVEKRPDGSPVGEPAAPGTVRRSRMVDVPPGTAAALDATGTKEAEGYSGEQLGRAEAGVRPGARPARQPVAPGTVWRPSVMGEAGAGTEAAPGAGGAHVEGGLPGDESGPTSADSGTAPRLAGEPAGQRVQRSKGMDEAYSGTESPPEAMGTDRVEGRPAGEAGSEASPLQRRAMGDARDPTAPDAVDAAAGPPGGTQPGRGPYASASAGGKGGEGSAAARLGLVRPVRQTRSVEQTAILPQLRRPPAQPRARLSQIPPRGEPGGPGMGAAKEAHLASFARLEPGGPGMGTFGEPHLPPSARLSQIPSRGELGVRAVTVQPPVQPAVQPTREAIIQRQTSIPGVAIAISRAEAGEAAGVQRTEEEGVEAGAEARDEEQDLDRLARDVYPLVKRLLAIERERRAGRWR